MIFLGLAIFILSCVASLANEGEKETKKKKKKEQKEAAGGAGQIAPSLGQPDQV